MVIDDREDEQRFYLRLDMLMRNLGKTYIH